MSIEKLNFDEQFVKEHLQQVERLSQALKKLQADFDVEKDCKNEVYYYILNRGLLDDYRTYHQNPNSQFDINGVVDP